MLIRFQTFIKEKQFRFLGAWWEGDGREFEFNGGYRTRHDVLIDFVGQTVRQKRLTGLTCKSDEADVPVEEKTCGQANADEMSVQHVLWHPDHVQFHVRGSAKNPLVGTAFPLDYEFDVVVRNDEYNMVTLSGRHDGAPCYEVYKCASFNNFVPLPLYRWNSQSLLRLGGIMEIRVPSITG